MADLTLEYLKLTDVVEWDRNPKDHEIGKIILSIRRFFQEWHKQWCRWRKQDQLALLRALYRQPVRVAPMRAPWNTHRKSVARFVHHRHRTVARKGAPG